MTALEPTSGGSIQVVALRLALLEQDGTPLPGSQNLYVTDAVSKIEVNPIYTKGVDFEVINGQGAPQVLYKDMDWFKRYDLNMDLIYQDPILEGMLIGGLAFTSQGETVGTSGPEPANHGGYFPGVSLEAWSKHITNGDIDPTYPYIRYVLPRTKWVRDKMTLDNSPMPQAYMGFTSANPNFYNGPANDWPYDSTRQLSWAYDTAIPDVSVGAQALVAVGRAGARDSLQWPQRHGGLPEVRGHEVGRVPGPARAGLA